jgi:hypothetical protein
MANIDLTEKLANLGYLMISEEQIKGDVAIPENAVPLYSEDLTINVNLDEDNPIMGVRAARYDVFRGQEDYQGTIKVLAEPQTAGHLFSMLLKKGTSTGSATTGYTHPYTLDKANAYTIEFNKGDIPFRFFGVEAKSIGIAFEDNKMVFNIAISALGQFSVAKISSVGATSVALDDSERQNPTDGLAVGDTLRLYDVSEANYEEVTISNINADGKTLTVSSVSGSYIAGDLCWLKPQTPSFDIDEPFTWSRTEFRFGSTAATALTATQTRVEQGSDWNIMYNFEDDAGAKRSGKQRPEALVRTQGDVEINLKKFFKDGQELDRFLQKSDRALVIRHFSPSDAGSDGTESELRITINEYYLKENNIPLNSGEIIYGNMVLVPVYDSTDEQMFDVLLINSESGYVLPSSSSSSSCSSSFSSSSSSESA